MTERFTLTDEELHDIKVSLDKRIKRIQRAIKIDKSPQHKAVGEVVEQRLYKLKLKLLAVTRARKEG